MSEILGSYCHYAIVTYKSGGEFKTHLIDFNNEGQYLLYISEEEIKKRIEELYNDTGIEIISSCTIN